MTQVKFNHCKSCFSIRWGWGFLYLGLCSFQTRMWAWDCWVRTCLDLCMYGCVYIYIYTYLNNIYIYICCIEKERERECKWDLVKLVTTVQRQMWCIYHQDSRLSRPLMMYICMDCDVPTTVCNQFLGLGRGSKVWETEEEHSSPMERVSCICMLRWNDGYRTGYPARAAS